MKVDRWRQGMKYTEGLFVLSPHDTGDMHLWMWRGWDKNGGDPWYDCGAINVPAGERSMDVDEKELQKFRILARLEGYV